MSMLSRFATLGGQLGPPDPYWANVSYLLVGNGANGTTTNIKDSSSNNISTTANGGLVISTAISPPSVTNAGSGTVYFNGSGTYFTLPNSTALEFGSGNLTLEMWLNTTSTNLYACVFGRQAATTFSGGDLVLLLNIGTPGNIGLFTAAYSGTTPIVQTTGVTINNGAWHHIAVVRNGSSWVLYVDGQSRGAQTFSGTLATSSATWYSGIYPPDGNGPGRDVTGYMYDFRITKGVARYTANFTPPTKAFPTY